MIQNGLKRSSKMNGEGNGWILFLRRTYTFEVLGLIEDCRFSKASFNLIEGFSFFSSAISA